MNKRRRRGEEEEGEEEEEEAKYGKKVLRVTYVTQKKVCHSLETGEMKVTPLGGTSNI